MVRNRFLATLLFVSLSVIGMSCNKNSSGPTGTTTLTRDQLIQKGRVTYQANCIACHNMDPKKAGTLGPEVFGSSRELIEARILRAEYPPGYTPKRSTHTMAALPHLKNDLDALSAYLNER